MISRRSVLQQASPSCAGTLEQATAGDCPQELSEAGKQLLFRPASCGVELPSGVTVQDAGVEEDDSLLLVNYSFPKS